MKSKMLKMIMLVTVFMLTMACGSKSADGKKKYTIGIDTSFPPFEYKKDSKYTGIDIELLQAIGKLEGFAGASITEERKKSVDFSDPYYESGLVALVNKGNSTIKTVKDLEGKRLVVKNGTAGAKFAEDNLKGKATIRVFEDSASTLKAVENNQADAAFEDYPVIAYTIKVNPNLNVKIGTEKLTNNEYGFMVKKGENKELLEKFNKGLKTLKENGEYQKIVDKYTK